jgi:hypothetical protein
MGFDATTGDRRGAISRHMTKRGVSNHLNESLERVERKTVTMKVLEDDAP